MIIKYRAFTLIELLIVIAIIAVLLTMLIPALQAAKDQARTAICGTHLKQWGAIFKYYTDANQGRFMDPLGVPEDPALVNSSGQILWVEPMRRYYKGTGDKMRMCPTAKRTVEEGAEYSFAAWSVNYAKFGEDEFRSSYGINNWIYPSLGQASYKVGRVGSWGWPGSLHPNGCQVTMGDGSVRFVPQNADATVRLNMAAMMDGKHVELP